MQTFLPEKDFVYSAWCLDYKRLGKQRVECKQIYKALTGTGSLRWKHHPAVKMWKGYELALLDYAIVICTEWRLREYKDSLLPFFKQEYDNMINSGVKLVYPNWLGNEEFHASHRSNLLRKDKEYYSKFGWTEPDNLPYIWLK